LASVKYKASLIAEYEVLFSYFSYFSYSKKEPRYIYYIGNFNYQQKWLNKNREYYKSLAKNINNHLLILKNSNFDDNNSNNN
jgi:hypothetical protein